MMKVTKINDWFEKAGRFEVKHRWGFIIGLVVFTILCCLGLAKLRFNNGEADWFDDWDTVKKNQDHFEEMFGSTDSLMCHITASEGTDVFDPEILGMIRDLGDDLLMNVPYADTVTSLTSLSMPIGTSDGFDILDPFGDGIPTAPEEIEMKKNQILSRESLVDILVSKDCKETWLILNLEHYTETLSEVQKKIAVPAMEIFNLEKYKSDKWTIRPAGLSYTEYEEDIAAMEQCFTRIAIGFIVMVLCLVFFIRSLRGVIVPTISTVFAICSTLGGSAWLGIDANTIMLVVPVLLAMALAVGYAVHYVNSFRLHFRSTGKRKESVILGVRDSGWALLFTVVTTMGGMLSFFSGGIKTMRWVGGITAVAVFMVFVYTMILLPCFYSFGKDKTPDPKYVKSAGSTKADFGIERMGKAILNKKWITVASGVVVLIVSIPGLVKIKVNMNYNDMMGEKIPYVKRLMEICNSELGSQYSYDVLIEYSDEDKIKDPKVLKNMDILSDRIGSLSMTKVTHGKPRISSVTKIVKEMNRALNEDREDMYVIPDDESQSGQILGLYEVMGGKDLYQYVTQDFKAAFIHVELAGYDAEECLENLSQVEVWIKELFPGTETSGVVGEAMQYASMNGKLVRGSIKSIGTSFIVIFFLLSLAFMSFRTGFIGMIPNVSPVLLCGAIMGYSGINLDMITAMIMPMVLGIAVDDTIHFTNHIKYHFELTGNYRAAVLGAYREIGKSMIMTTLILCMMFMIFLSSSMTALVRIGYLSIVGLASALVADYTLTPVLMYISRPFGKETNSSLDKTNE